MAKAPEGPEPPTPQPTKCTATYSNYIPQIATCITGEIRDIFPAPGWGNWTCPYCNGVNPNDKYKCLNCGAPRKEQ